MSAAPPAARRGHPLLSRAPLLVLGAILVGLGLGAYALGGPEQRTLQAVLAERATLQDWVAAHAVLAAAGFVAIYVTVAALAIPGALILSLLGGFLFGRWIGTALVLTGATSGALIAFMVARTTFGAPLRRRAGPLYASLAAGLTENAVEVILVLRLVPVVPFVLVNLVAALLEIRASTFALATLVGIAPATFLYTSIGRELGAVSSLSGLLSPAAIAALVGLAGLALVPVLVRRLRGRGAGP